MYRVADDNDEITCGTLIRVIQVGLANYRYNGAMAAALPSKSHRFEFENFQK
jgi:hypothetical protein